MSIEVACPNCQSRLKAPEGMAGKKARCKKCQHSFHLPGGPADDVDSVGDTEHLSEITASPFSFDGSPPSAPATKPAPAKASAKPADAPVPAGSNPFSIPAGASVDEPTPQPKSKSKYRQKADKPESHAKASPKPDRSAGSGKSKLLFALGALLCAGGGAAGFYFYSQMDKPKETPPTPAVAQTPLNDPPAVPDTAKETADAKPKAAAPAPRPAGRKVSGGMKLPPPADKPKPYEKALAVIPLEHDAAAVKQLIVGGTEGPVVLVVRRTFDGLGGKGTMDTVDCYAASTMGRLNSTKVPADAVTAYPRVCDISLGGQLFAFEHPAGKLSVTQLGAKEDVRILDGLDLAGDGGKKEPHPGIAALYFLTEELVAVVTKTGVVETWDVTAKKKTTASEPLPGAGTLVDKRTLAIHRHLDPTKSRIFAYAGGAVSAISLGGKPATALTLPRQPGDGLALAVDSSGNRLAVAYKAMEPGEHVRFVHARVGDPKPAGDESLDAEAGVPIIAEWTRPETFTILTDKGVGLAYDADAGVLIAGLRTATPKPLIAAEGSRHWCVLPNPADAKKAVLVQVAVPPEGYSPSLTGAKWAPFSLTISPDGTAK